MKRIDRTLYTDAQAQRVWDFMSDFTNTERWDPPTVSTIRTEGDGGIGTVYRNVSKFLGRKVETTYTVVDFVPGERLILRGRAASMQTLDTIEVSRLPYGSRLRYVAEFHPQGPARLLEPLLHMGLKRLGDKAEAQMSQCFARL